MDTRKIGKYFGAVIGAALLAPPVAAAGDYKITSAAKGAVYVWNGGAPGTTSTPSYYWFYVKDDKADGYTVHGNFSNAKGVGSLDNNSGGGTTANRWTGARITAIQACVNHTLLPDECSAWK